MNKQKGFTIIELIVVIAIIAILAAIVLINVTQYINKAKDAAMKGNLHALITDAITYGITNSSYSGFSCSTNPAWVAVNKIQPTGNGTASCVVNIGSETVPESTAFCACVKLLATADWYCVDSTGASLDVNFDCTTISNCGDSSANASCVAS